MSDKKQIHRWLVVAGSIIVQLCMGAIYTWSIFVDPLKEQFEFSTLQTQIVFSFELATFSLVMIFAGKWQDKAGPRIVAFTGSILLGTGYILASFSHGSFIGILCTIGLISGAGIGLAYVCPIAALIKWFPDMRGLITGIAVAGFGGGAWIFAHIANHMIDSCGTLETFKLLGIIFLVVSVLGSLVITNPPRRWVPSGFHAKQPDGGSAVPSLNWHEMIRTPRFYFLWSMFSFSALAGLMVIGNLKSFGIHNGLSSAAAGSAVGVLALFNGLGRIKWGWISDKLGRSHALLLMFALQSVMMFILPHIGKSTLLLAVSSAWVGFNFGGNFALFPSLTADYFGTRFIGINYGLVYTAYGVAGIAGPISAGEIFDLTGSYTFAFMIAGCLCAVAAVTVYFTHRTVKKTA
ncbi:MAG: OFA family MFS transporter [bacterium]|nr:OFA family MFS transporter [bacterium]